ncbi:MAG: glucosaminidase domain-containing protein [Chloroflexi bacterium]|nr:glucosaminidase domain-containing protein [Chloroflexota bacterium]
MPRLRTQHALLISAAAAYALSLIAPSVVQASAILSATHVAATAAQVAATAPQAAEAVAAPAQQANSAVGASGLQSSDAAALAPIADDVVSGSAAQADDAMATADVQAAKAEEAAPATQADLQTATVAPGQVENHLPAWVQMVVASGSLYAADASSDQVLAHLPRHTFLRVLGGGSSRIQVQTYDDSGAPGQTGWVTAEQVLPSAPGTDWLVSARSTPLWSGTDDSAANLRTIDAFSPLQKLDGPQLNRIQVNLYASDFSKIVASGWVDVAATGPALAPQVRVPAPVDRSLANRAATGSDQQMSFLNDAAIAARQTAALTGVPASVTVAQAILESDWGRSTLAQNANNFFGMKVMGTLGNDGLVWMPTSEYDASGQLYQTTSAFRAYKSLTDSMMDHDRLLAGASRYAAAMKVSSDPKQFASMIAQEGYSTDPAYADKLVALMDRYNLYQLDA